MGEPKWEAIILAGGEAKRLGGRDKAQLIGPDGRNCLETIVQGCASASKRVVVGPVRRGFSSVVWTQEEPPFSGPARGICAGMAMLADSQASWVIVLACDMPHVGVGVVALLDEASRLDAEGKTHVDGIVGISEDGQHQWLCAVYRKESLARACQRLPQGGTGESVRFLIGDLFLRELPMLAETVEDIDTADDMDTLGFSLRGYERDLVGLR